MKGRLHGLAAIGLAVLLGGSIAAWLMTREVTPSRTFQAFTPPPGGRVPKVDETPLQMARHLAMLADTRAEQELVEQAARLAGQEVDQDFATAIREAASLAPPVRGPLHDLAAHIANLKARVAASLQRVAQLTKEAATDSAAADRLELANAQLALDQDELDDEQQDLAREGGDPRANLQRAQQEHQTVRQGALPLGKLSTGGPPATLREQIQEWFALGSRQDQVQAGKQEADKKAATLQREHNALVGKLGSAPAAPTGDANGNANGDDDTVAVVAQLRRLSDQRKTLADLDKRTEVCQELSGVYKKWLASLEDRRRALLHLLLGSIGTILAILLTSVLVIRAIAQVLARLQDRRRLHQLRVITSIAIQIVAAMLILLVIFGAPTQMPTIIGLATAGLTVVLKDFIVAFFGWFVLMGRHGIGQGDWVEINGVGGEVIEVGILRTVLLEMGNWTNTGHPTGRRVGFMNGFAIEGQYFNFSTAGQWLWDELQVTLPAGGDPYQMAEQIRQIVERETGDDAKMAEQDWERVTHQYGTRVFSAKPAADLRPSPAGLVVTMRYITRAPLRYEVKSRLFKSIVELMQNPDKPAAKSLPVSDNI
jgi:hypothetical protein